MQGCTQILEPISLKGMTEKILLDNQEEFKVNVKALNFKNAQEANKYPYQRKLMQKGTGSNANLFDETKFTNVKIPDFSERKAYLLGIGDVVLFKMQSEFMTDDPQWPKNPTKDQYLIGVGDRLAFIQQNEELEDNYKVLLNQSEKNTENSVMGSLGSGSKLGNNTKGVNSIITTESIVGTNGSILFIGLGKINAANRTLTDVRTEVRNVLIRNGLAPNFQLEITGFFSKKAFVNTSNQKSSTISIDSIPKTLKEVALGAGALISSKNSALITLTRDSKNFRYTAEQLFSKTAPEIYIQNADKIEVVFVSESDGLGFQTTVGTRGNILLPEIGTIEAVGRSLKDIQSEIAQILRSQGLKPKFQLELMEFFSQKVFIIEENSNSRLVPLTNKNNTLQELVLNGTSAMASSDGITLITLQRDQTIYKISALQLLSANTKDIWLQDNDKIHIKRLNYKPGQVFAISGAGNAEIIPIEPSQRETLADVLFVKGGALKNILAQRSEVYLLRGKNPSVAYHLDTQNVSRLLVAAKTELRPNDIIFVAERPIISFARTLSEINPLRTLISDLQDNNFP